MTIATNNDNSRATSTASQADNSPAVSNVGTSAGRRAHRQTAINKPSPAETAATPSSENTDVTTDVRPSTKTDTVLDLLRRADGASLPEISAATSWQAHSVRGFLSGTVRKKLGLNLVSVISADGVRRYTIAEAAAPAEPAQPIDLPAFGSFRGAAAVEHADTTQEA